MIAIVALVIGFLGSGLALVGAYMYGPPTWRWILLNAGAWIVAILLADLS